MALFAFISLGRGQLSLLHGESKETEHVAWEGACRFYCEHEQCDLCLLPLSVTSVPLTQKCCQRRLHHAKPLALPPLGELSGCETFSNLESFGLMCDFRMF